MGSEIEGMREALLVLQQSKHQIEGRIRQLQLKIAVADGKCDHEFYDVHDSMGDYRDPTGARCSICDYQIWF